jgi:hypothetical protein
MPVADTEKRIDFQPLLIDDSIADLGSQQGLCHLCLNRRRNHADGKRLIVRKLYPQEIDGHDHAVVANLDGSHQTNIELGEYVAGVCMNAGFSAEGPDCPVDTGEPEIRSDPDVPVPRPCLCPSAA